eukprot:4589669-Pyramimonas_sp.AAC.1
MHRRRRRRRQRGQERLGGVAPHVLGVRLLALALPPFQKALPTVALRATASPPLLLARCREGAAKARPPPKEAD